MTNDAARPSVRIEFEQDSAASAPAPEAPTGRNSGPAVLVAVIAALLAGTFALSTLGSSEPEEPIEAQPDLAAPSIALIDERLAESIDAFDRITFAPNAPPLTSIHRAENDWVSLDSGLLLRSPDLISWTTVTNLWDIRALALDSSTGDTLVLAESDQAVIIQPVDGGVPIASVEIEGQAIMGALRYPHWAVVELDEDGLWLTTGNQSELLRRAPLSQAPESLAITETLLIATSPTDFGTWLWTMPLADTTEQWCQFGVGEAMLVSTGDDVVHLVEATQVSTFYGSSLLLQVDSTLVDPTSSSSVAPLATGAGWSISTGLDSGTPEVWITADGERVERQEIPTTEGSPSRVVWAYLDASEGVGIEISQDGATPGLLRVGDPRTRHPRPQDLGRTEFIEVPAFETPLRYNGGECFDSTSEAPLFSS